MTNIRENAIEFARKNSSRFEQNLCDLIKIPSVSTNPENKQEIINKIRFLINNPEIYNRYKQNCINASAKLNWEAQESKFLKIFE